MYATERQQLIEQLITTEGRVVVIDLARRFGVTTETVRRDLDQLESAGLVRRVHGGAVARTRVSTAETSFVERTQRRTDAKLAIAARALDAIGTHGDGSVYIDAGTTTAALAGLLAQRATTAHPLEVVTHSMTVAHLLAGAPALNLTAIGGRVRGLTAAAVGAQTVDAISRLRPDLAFIGTNGLSAAFGLSTPDPDEAAVKRAVIASARRIVVLADAEKFDGELLVSFGRLADLDILVTDAEPPADLVAALGDADVEVVDRMIVTLTANPSLDRTVTLSDALRVGEVQSALSVREDAGGKGINVTRVLAGSGVATRAVLPLDADDPFAAVLRSAHVPVLAVPLPGTARANLTLTDSDGVTTKINLPGVTRTAQDAATLIDATVRASADADWLVLAGSLPPGLSEDFYVDVITAVRAAGASAPRIAVDTSGPALRAVVERGRPDLIKPNDEELVELAGVALDAELPLPEAVLAVARQLVPTRVGAAFVTLGGDGAVLVDPDGAWFGTPPPTRVRSTVGAGDSSLAGFLLADVAGAAPDERVRSGIRYGSAAAALPGTQAPTPTDLLPGDVPVRPLAL